MLGNFSFGPKERGAYFKEEAIALAWEFATKVLGLPTSRLYASIFAGEGKLPRDDQAEVLWKKIGVAPAHIVALGRADNFWGPAGGQGACGPCSEPASISARARRIWRKLLGGRGRAGDPHGVLESGLPQFDAKQDGTLEPLRGRHDTGMGPELRDDAGPPPVFDTDLFQPLVL
jgi:alanyl-tRNA synthetase